MKFLILKNEVVWKDGFNLIISDKLEICNCGNFMIENE